jgi:hypothetical protein
MTRAAEALTPRQFAERLGFKPNYGNQLLKDGRLVLAPDGKHVLLAESMARFEATKDPSRQGVADRHAAGREAASAAAEEDEEDDRPPPAPAGAGGNTGNSYQQARAVKERYLALEAKRAYEVAIGQLRDGREVEALAASAMTELRLRLENLASTLAPVLAAQTDEVQIRANLQDNFAHALESASQHFARLAAGSKA